MISAETVRPLLSFSSVPSPASRTSSSAIVEPASPASFSTTILSPAATRYCLPPVRTTANMAYLFILQCLCAKQMARPNAFAREAGPLLDCVRSVNAFGAQRRHFPCPAASGCPMPQPQEHRRYRHYGKSRGHQYGSRCYPAVTRVELRSEEHTSELKSLMRISYAVFCLKKQKHTRDKPSMAERYNTHHN